MKDLHSKYGDCYRLWFGYDLLVVFSDPKDIEVILSSTSTSMTTKSDAYNILKPWLGSGLLLTSGKFKKKKYFNFKNVYCCNQHIE